MRRKRSRKGDAGYSTGGIKHPFDGLRQEYEFGCHGPGPNMSTTGRDRSGRGDGPGALGGVEVVEERIVRDGNIWTCAGVSSGTDLALELIASVAGEETARRFQLAAGYYPSGRRFGKAHRQEAAADYVKRAAKAGE